MSTAGFHITEDCAEVYLQNESGMEFLQLARRLHDYLQQGQRLPARSLFEATDDCKEISREAFDALAKHRMENTGEVSGLFELDFDARTFSALNIMDGWKAYAMDDIAAAAEAAFQEAEISEDARWRIFLDRLDGQDLTTPSRLTARNFYFEDIIMPPHGKSCLCASRASSRKPFMSRYRHCIGMRPITMRIRIRTFT